MVPVPVTCTEGEEHEQEGISRLGGEGLENKQNMVNELMAHWITEFLVSSSDGGAAGCSQNHQQGASASEGVVFCRGSSWRRWSLADAMKQRQVFTNTMS